MAELTAEDVEAYTQGQLSANNDETQRMLDAALAHARRDVRWFVSPVQVGETVTLNGTGTNRLRLPTQKVVKINSITDGGVALDPDTDVTLDGESGNLLLKNVGRFCNTYNGVVINMDHGYTEAEAADWRQAILDMTSDLAAIGQAGRADGDMTSKQVDDVVYKWVAGGGLGTAEQILARYRLLYRWV